MRLDEGEAQMKLEDLRDMARKGIDRIPMDGVCQRCREADAVHFLSDWHGDDIEGQFCDECMKLISIPERRVVMDGNRVKALKGKCDVTLDGARCNAPGKHYSITIDKSSPQHVFICRGCIGLVEERGYVIEPIP